MTGRKRGRRDADGLTPALAAGLCVLAAAIFGAPPAHAAAPTGVLGQSEVVVPSLGDHYEETAFSRIEARPDGGVIAERGDQLESYLADGSPDPAAPPTSVPSNREVFPLPSGKSIVRTERTLTRINPDGSVDTSFGAGGDVKLPTVPQAVAELPSGKLLVAGTELGLLHEYVASVNIELIEPDGSVDRSVGTDGVLKLSLSPDDLMFGSLEAVPTPDGGALVTGGQFMLEVRADGSANQGFGSGGLVVGLPTLVGAHVFPDGSVEAIGYGSDQAPDDLVVLRYTAAGTPDPGFGSGGIRNFDLGGNEAARSAIWAADGSVVVGGTTRVAGNCVAGNSCEETPLLVGFDPGGNLDPGFGEGGVLRLTALAAAPGNWSGGGVLAMTRRPDGSIVAAGTAPPNRTVAFLAAISPRGALLTGFGEGGFVRAREPVPASQWAAGLSPLPDGGLLAAATSNVGVENHPVLIRYGADGSLDRSFGAGAGYVSVGDVHFVAGFAVDPAGRSLVAVSGYPRSSLLLRAADGAAETSFGDAGEVWLPRHVLVEALGFDAAGDAIVIGSHDVAGDTEPGVVLRLRPNGARDRRFGGDGRVTLGRIGGTRVKARALGGVHAGRLLVGGLADRRFAIAGLLADGRPDRRFGSGGWALARAGGVAKALAVKRSGPWIYAAGVARDGDQLRVVLLRFDNHGRIDRAFGRRGRLVASIPAIAEPKAIVPTRRGVLVVLSRGKAPLLSFGRDGRVRRYLLGKDGEDVSDVRAAVSGGRLILGWNAFSRQTHRDVYHLAL